MKKLVILDSVCCKQNDLNFHRFNDLCEVVEYERTQNHKVIERISNAEIVITNKNVIDKNVIDACKNLKYVSVLATGYNNIDIQYAKQKNVLVSNVPQYSTESVVQHTFALILAISSGIITHSSSVMAGQWQKNWIFVCT